jgi:hypothetical protein
MTRNLKIVGLALLLAALAVSALAATGAFAGEEDPEEGKTIGELSAKQYPATLDGTDKANETNAFTLSTLKIECPDSSYTGSIAAATTTFTIMPTYNNCVQGTRKATVITNGCGYQIELLNTTTLGYKDNYFFLTNIICPENKDIEIRIFEGGTENVEYCKFTIKEQKGLKKGKLQNEPVGGVTNGTFKLERFIDNIVATKSSDAGGCGNEEVKDGRYHIGIGFKGTTNAGGVNDVTVSHPMKN